MSEELRLMRALAECWDVKRKAETILRRKGEQRGSVLVYEDPNLKILFFPEYLNLSIYYMNERVFSMLDGKVLYLDPSEDWWRYFSILYNSVKEVEA